MVRKYEVLILWSVIILFLGVMYKLNASPYFGNFIIIERNITKSVHKFVPRDKIVPLSFNKECGNKHIIFVSYLSSLETERQTEKFCNLFKNGG